MEIVYRMPVWLYILGTTVLWFVIFIVVICGLVALRGEHNGR